MAGINIRGANICHAVYPKLRTRGDITLFGQLVAVLQSLEALSGDVDISS